MLKAIGVTCLGLVAILAGALVFVTFSPDPLQAHLQRIAARWEGDPSQGRRLIDLLQAAEAGLTYGCQTAGLYPHHGFDYADHLRITVLSRREWPEKRLVFTFVDGDARSYVAHLDGEQRTELCRVIAERAASAGY